jgi:hypothetical protein
MNAFYEHSKDNIRFAYCCFDRILLNATIQPFQQEQRAVGFFWTYRQIYPVSRQVLRDIATQYHNWAKSRSQKWRVPIQKDPQAGAMTSWIATSDVPNPTKSWPSSSARASHHHDRHRERRPLASRDEAALGRAIQLEATAGALKH